jgi:hypothetical protein
MRGDRRRQPADDYPHEQARDREQSNWACLDGRSAFFAAHAVIISEDQANALASPKWDMNVALSWLGAVVLSLNASAALMTM